ncbi:uncharacterized protein LOC143569378 [Bidens hawaiensis]|uniref:uncharacterized protein LOC143569378 n=1 Tax=Bidens hawaiensis TaxID=980011 RepID=UPI0040493026
MTTHNMSMDQRVQEHDVVLNRMDSAITKNAENIASMKSQMENQMNELIQSIQALSNNQNNNHHNHGAGWLCRVEHFFEIDATPENLKVRYAVVHLEDVALLWHQSFVRSRGGSIEGMLWYEYKGFIVSRFGLGLNQYAMGSLADLKQTNQTLEDFCKEFDLASTRVDICDEYAVSMFLRAIKPEIGNPVKLIRPKTLPEAYMLARVQNDNNMSLVQPIRSFKPSNSLSNYKTTDYGNRSGGGGVNLPLLPAPSLKSKLPNARKLSHKEIEEKRAKGECFGCTEKYTLTHIYKNKQLFSIEIVEIEEAEYHDPVEIIRQELQDPCISLNAIMGMNSFSTMRVKGSIGTKPLQILIDSGSTHNFLDRGLATKMKCPVKSIKELSITIADGNKLPCTHIRENFKWCMQGNWFTIDVMLISLSNYDMVLGVQWLKTLNDIMWNFKELTMKFKVADKMFELKGIDSDGMQLCSSEKLESLLTQGVASAQLYSLQTVGGDSFQHDTTISQITPNNQLDTLLKQFQDMFEVPTTLPPKRNCDHRILLKDENVTVNQRAYRYPASQKDVLEKLPQELLDAGTIRNSQSTFASPVDESFIWTITTQEAFDQLKLALTSAPVLALPDFTKTFVIETDASSKVYEKELLAIMMAVKQWHHYLIAKRFLIKTDHKSLKFLLTQKITTPLQQSWLAKLMGYTYDIVYKKGTGNLVADGLSRMQGLALFELGVSTIDPMLLQRIKASWEFDAHLQSIIQKLVQGQSVLHVTWADNLLRRNTKLWIGNDSQLKIFWNYFILQQWGVIQGKDTILVIVDRLTKYAHFTPLAHPFTAPQIAQIFLDTIFKLHGNPLTIVSDRDPIFTPQQWLKWVSLAEWWYNTTYHSSIQTTPFEALYGYPPPLHNPYIPNDTKVEAVEVLHRDREAMITCLKQTLNDARNRMKQYADSHRSERCFTSGDWIGAVAYKLDLPQDSHMHPVFHVSLLKKAHGQHSPTIPLPAGPRFLFQPRAIIDKRLARKGTKLVSQVLVHWHGVPLADATWEFEDEFQLRFPCFS